MPSRKKTKNPRGHRYTVKEKLEVLAYVESVNAERGRGGRAEAAGKFGISLPSLSNWMKAGPRSSGRSSFTRDTLAKLAALHARIVEKESELAKLRGEFDRIKRSI